MSPIPSVAVVMVAAAIPPAVLAGTVWQDRTEPGAKPFVVYLGAIVAFDLLYAVSLSIYDAVLNKVLFVTLASLTLISALVWLLFVLEYTGRSGFVSGCLVWAVVAIPSLGSLLHFWPDGGPMLAEFGIVRVNGATVVAFDYTPLGLSFAALGYVALLAGLALLLAFLVTDRSRYGLQASVLSVVVGLHAGALFLRVRGLSPTDPINLTPLAWALGALIALYALRHWDLFGFTPAILRIGQVAAFDDLGEPVLIVDEDYRLVDVNVHAVDLLQQTTDDLVEQPLRTVLDADVDLDDGDRSVRLETARGHRDFDVTASPIGNSWGGTIGYTVVLHDVTDEKRRRQRLEVLNRILRHNLRNSTNAVIGYSRELGTHVDGTAEWMVERIEKQTMELVELSEKARDIDRVTTPAAPSGRFHVADSLAQVSDRLDEPSRDLTVTLDVADGLAITTNKTVFEETVRYAACSLLGYNETDDPHLVISAAAADGPHPRIDCTIRSNGDPIPEDERTVIEQGRETPLDHSQDLDLWLAAWGIDTLGGDLEFVLEDDRPSLSLSIPDTRSPATSENHAIPATRAIPTVL